MRREFPPLMNKCRLGIILVFWLELVGTVTTKDPNRSKTSARTDIPDTHAKRPPANWSFHCVTLHQGQPAEEDRHATWIGNRPLSPISRASTFPPSERRRDRTSSYLCSRSRVAREEHDRTASIPPPTSSVLPVPLPTVIGTVLQLALSS